MRQKLACPSFPRNMNLNKQKWCKINNNVFFIVTTDSNSGADTGVGRRDFKIFKSCIRPCCWTSLLIFLVYRCQATLTNIQITCPSFRPPLWLLIVFFVKLSKSAIFFIYRLWLINILFGGRSNASNPDCQWRTLVQALCYLSMIRLIHQ